MPVRHVRVPRHLIVALGVMLALYVSACTSGPATEAPRGEPVTTPVVITRTVRPPASPQDLKGEHVEDVCYRFAQAGFTQIVPREDADLRVALMHKEGDVSRVTIEGTSDFDEDDEFAPDVRVVVEYHTFRKESKRNISLEDLEASVREWVSQQRE